MPDVCRFKQRGASKASVLLLEEAQENTDVENLDLAGYGIFAKSYNLGILVSRLPLSVLDQVCWQVD